MTRVKAWRLPPWGLWLALGIGCWLIAGCDGTKNPAGAEVQTSKLRAIAVLYNQYQSSQRRQPPENEAEFKAYLKTLPQSQLDAWKISDIDQAFVSDRDNEPYVILYGKQAASGRLIGSEKHGKDGKRMVAHHTGQVELVDEAQFQKLASATAK
jgi:hypothetical protein